MYTSFEDFDKNLFFNESFIHIFYCPLKKSNYHNHNFFELVYVVNGKGLHKLDNDIREITVGDYMFMDYSTFHEYEALTDDFAVINCLFLSKAIDKTMSDCRDFNELLKSYNLRLSNFIFKEKTVNRFFKDTDNEIGAILQDMCKECGEKQAGYIDYVKSSLIQIIIKTIRQTAVDIKDDFSPPVLKVLNSIEQRYCERLQLSDIANELFISVPYISLKFKQETGVTFSEYLKNVRIQKACALLTTTDLKVHVIAEKVGYSDYKRFGSVFREITGVSPGKFRAQSNK